MSLFFLYYLLPGLLSGAAVSGSQGAGNPHFSPLNFIIYGSVFIVTVIFLVFVQTINLRKAHHLLKEKALAFDQIEKQKTELEIRDKNMTDSLIYAQRIQEALLPSEEYLKKFFRESFIFFKPKDIVSGDFYWIGEKGDKIFVVAADCTGHGVPGALMSMIGLEIIENAINEYNIEKPAAILALLNKDLEKTFNREKNIGNIIRDGMDIGLCVVDRKNNRIEYSGAFFPLYLFRDNTLTEIKGDKVIIGMNPKGVEYTSHEFGLEEDDILYIFSDGYVDQFGGIENRKFMYRRFRYLLTTINGFPLDDQKAIISDTIKTWMGNNPQLDDMMILGFKPVSGKAK